MASKHNRGYWIDTSPQTDYPRLVSGTKVDVAVIGAGIVGITTAFLLKRAGLSVALIEARRAAEQVTGYTTAKITSLHGMIYADLAKSFGDEVAAAYGRSNEAALAKMADLIRDLGIDCGFERVPAYIFCMEEANVASVKREAEVAARLGLPARFVDRLDVPFPFAGAVCFDHQAQFHPRLYLLALLREIPGNGSHVFEASRVLDVTEGSPCRIATGDGELIADNVVVATNLPILDRGGFFALAYPYAHVALAAYVAPESVLDGMFISVEEPTRSVRFERHGERPVLVATGAGYKAGQGDPEAAVRDLEEWLRSHFDVQAIHSRWSNEDFVSKDRIPYIGRMQSGNDTLWTATGFGAWGMTGGTLAGMILCDLIRGVPNPWADVYDATRTAPTKGAGTFLRENLNVAKEWVGGHLSVSTGRTVADLKPGEGGVVTAASGQVAAWRDEGGRVHAVSATCTHMGCTVAWNGLSKSWDCPCHGSRFDVDGSVIFGPATTPLAPVEDV